MKHEFTKIKSKNETRYVLENSSAGATSAASVGSGSVVKPLGGVRRRAGDNLLAQEADNKKEAPKPRNFVAKNAKMGGAGQHKDKKKAQKQGQEKHRKPYMEELQDRIAELKDKLSEISADPAYLGAAERSKSQAQATQRTFGKSPEEKAAARRTELKREKGIAGYSKRHRAAHPEMYPKVTPRPAPKLRDPSTEYSDDYSTWAKGRRDTMEQGVAEGSEFGAYYGEQVAQQIFNKRQDITSEDEVLNQAYHIVANDQGQKSARYMFNYDEDFPSDVVSAYFWLQKNSGSVTEYGDTAKGQKMLSKVHHRAADRVTSKQADKDPAYARKAQQTQDRAWDRLATKEEVGYNEVSPKSASYILRKLDQGVMMSDIIDDFPELRRMMDEIAHEHGLHPDDDFEQIEDILANDLEDIAAQEDEFGDYDQDEELPEVAPKGWEGTVKAMKKHKDIDNPWALANWMKSKGYKSHKEDAYMENLSAKLAEKLDPNADPDVWVQDFQKADPNRYHQFRNKTPEKKAQMAISARYAARQPKSKR